MKDFKFSCLPLSLYDDIYSGRLSVTGLSYLAAYMGYDGIDINEYFVRDFTCGDITSLREKLSVPVVSMCAYSDFTNSDPFIIKGEVARAVENIKKAACIGASYIRLTAGPAYEYCDSSNTIESIYSCFSRCAEAAEKNGVRILLENHLQALSWDHPDYDFDYDRMILLWDRLKSLPIAVNFDTANAYALGNWQGLLSVLLDSIESIHINDIASMEPFRCSVAGEGIVCIEDMLKIIFDNGFTGWITIEEAGFEGAEGMARAIKNARAICSRMTTPKRGAQK